MKNYPFIFFFIIAFVHFAPVGAMNKAKEEFCLNVSFGNLQLDSFNRIQKEIDQRTKDLTSSCKKAVCKGIYNNLNFYKGIFTCHWGLEFIHSCFDRKLPSKSTFIVLGLNSLGYLFYWRHIHLKQKTLKTKYEIEQRTYKNFATEKREDLKGIKKNLILYKKCLKQNEDSACKARHKSFMRNISNVDLYCKKITNALDDRRPVSASYNIKFSDLDEKFGDKSKLNFVKEKTKKE